MLASELTVLLFFTLIALLLFGFLLSLYISHQTTPVSQRLSLWLKSQNEGDLLSEIMAAQTECILDGLRFSHLKDRKRRQLSIDAAHHHHHHHQQPHHQSYYNNYGYGNSVGISGFGTDSRIPNDVLDQDAVAVAVGVVGYEDDPTMDEIWRRHQRQRLQAGIDGRRPLHHSQRPRQFSKFGKRNNSGGHDSIVTGGGGMERGGRASGGGVVPSTTEDDHLAMSSNDEDPIGEKLWEFVVGWCMIGAILGGISLIVFACFQVENGTAGSSWWNMVDTTTTGDDAQNSSLMDTVVNHILKIVSGAKDFEDQVMELGIFVFVVGVNGFVLIRQRVYDRRRRYEKRLMKLGDVQYLYHQQQQQQLQAQQKQQLQQQQQQQRGLRALGGGLRISGVSDTFGRYHGNDGYDEYNANDGVHDEEDINNKENKTDNYQEKQDLDTNPVLTTINTITQPVDPNDNKPDFSTRSFVGWFNYLQIMILIIEFLQLFSFPLRELMDYYDQVHRTSTMFEGAKDILNTFQVAATSLNNTKSSIEGATGINYSNGTLYYGNVTLFNFLAEPKDEWSSDLLGKDENERDKDAGPTKQRMLTQLDNNNHKKTLAHKHHLHETNNNKKKNRNVGKKDNGKRDDDDGQTSFEVSQNNNDDGSSSSSLPLSTQHQAVLITMPKIDAASPYEPPTWIKDLDPTNSSSITAAWLDSLSTDVLPNMTSIITNGTLLSTAQQQLVNLTNQVASKANLTLNVQNISDAISAVSDAATSAGGVAAIAAGAIASISSSSSSSSSGGKGIGENLLGPTPTPVPAPLIEDDQGSGDIVIQVVNGLGLQPNINTHEWYILRFWSCFTVVLASWLIALVIHSWNRRCRKKRREGIPHWPAITVGWVGCFIPIVSILYLPILGTFLSSAACQSQAIHAYAHEKYVRDQEQSQPLDSFSMTSNALNQFLLSILDPASTVVHPASSLLCTGPQVPFPAGYLAASLIAYILAYPLFMVFLTSFEREPAKGEISFRPNGVAILKNLGLLLAVDFLLIQSPAQRRFRGLVSITIMLTMACYTIRMRPCYWEKVNYWRTFTFSCVLYASLLVALLCPSPTPHKLQGQRIGEKWIMAPNLKMGQPWMVGGGPKVMMVWIFAGWAVLIIFFVAVDKLFHRRWNNTKARLGNDGLSMTFLPGGGSGGGRESGRDDGVGGGVLQQPMQDYHYYPQLQQLPVERNFYNYRPTAGGPAAVMTAQKQQPQQQQPTPPSMSLPFAPSTPSSNNNNNNNMFIVGGPSRGLVGQEAQRRGSVIQSGWRGKTDSWVEQDDYDEDHVDLTVPNTAAAAAAADCTPSAPLRQQPTQQRNDASTLPSLDLPGSHHGASGSDPYATPQAHDPMQLHPLHQHRPWQARWSRPLTEAGATPSNWSIVDLRTPDTELGRPPLSNCSTDK